MKLSDFDFKLPDELIALNPAKPRDSSKLLRVNSSDSFEDTTFSQLTNFLNEGDVLVVNDTKVIPSKIFGFKVNAEKELTRISFTFFENKENGQWKALAKPARKINKNDLIFFKDDNDKFYDLFAQIIDKNEGEVTIDFASDNEKFINILKEKGDVMLPPYITSKRALNVEDNSDYQTIFQNKEGSIAAPTAGLHFTDNLIEKIIQKGVRIEKLTLNIGLGTFLPLRDDNVKENPGMNPGESKYVNNKPYKITIDDKEGNIYEYELDSILIIKPLEVYSVPDTIWDESDLEAIVMRDVE